MRRVLLDENLPRLLKRELPDVEVQTVAEAGWAGTKNGQLLRRAEGVFDVFVTADRNLPHQHTLETLELGIVVLAVGSTKLKDLQQHGPALSHLVNTVQPGQVLYLTAA